MEQDGGADNIVVGEHDFITLAQPRPGAARRLNEYIETPLRPQLPQQPAAKARLKKDAARSAVTTQPTLAAKPAKSAASLALPDPAGHGDSIICRQCHRCKCEACRGPRALPARWICHDKCLCSAANVVDYCSCMCCVRGLFYHYAKDSEMDSDVSCADQPCSCAPHKRLLRWGCLGLLALPLPCLCCYWPLRGCLKAGEACYSKCTGHGCRCAAPQHRTEQTPEKRLLDSNSDC
ncbi:protein sprouty-like [Uloborus diversus]|uniref:protein sprouty-like n=1 Tax=Uloborus diversus TaxID=327109 RepID=UPI0024092E14|nr:protein sprouty-like [Uloborus diversus]